MRYSANFYRAGEKKTTPRLDENKKGLAAVGLEVESEVFEKLIRSAFFDMQSVAIFMHAVTEDIHDFWKFRELIKEGEYVLDVHVHNKDHSRDLGVLIKLFVKDAGIKLIDVEFNDYNEEKEETKH